MYYSLFNIVYWYIPIILKCAIHPTPKGVGFPHISCNNIGELPYFSKTYWLLDKKYVKYIKGYSVTISCRLVKSSHPVRCANTVWNRLAAFCFLLYQNIRSISRVKLGLPKKNRMQISFWNSNLNIWKYSKLICKIITDFCYCCSLF